MNKIMRYLMAALVAFLGAGLWAFISMSYIGLPLLTAIGGLAIGMACFMWAVGQDEDDKTIEDEGEEQ